MAIVSLICLAFVIFCGAKFKKNCGIIAVLFAYVIGIFGVEMSAKAIYADGWPSNVIFTTLGVCLLFGVSNANGTTEKLAKNIVHYARGNRKALPVVFFIFCGILSGIGGGAPLCGMLLPLAMTIGVQNSIPPMIMALMSMGGLMVGGMSPLALNGIVASGLAIEAGMTNYTSIFLAYGVTMTAFSFGAYLLLGGLKLKKDEQAAQALREKMSVKQILTLAAILAVLVGNLVFGQEVSLLAYALAGILILLDFADEKAVIKSMPWNTVLMIAGMSILVNVVVQAGGIDLLSEAVSGLMNSITVYPVMVICGALLGAVSSGTGVAMPTLIPATAAIAQEMGTAVDMNLLILCVCIGINGVVISPLSTVGGMCLAGTPESVNKSKMFNQLLLSAVIMTALSAVLSVVGFYRLFM